MGQTPQKLVRPHLLGPAAPSKILLSGTQHQQSHKHTLYGWDTLVNGLFDQKAMVGRTWIDGPTLNRHSHHQGVILDVPQHRRCITRQLSRTGHTSRYDHTYQTLGFLSTNLGTDLGALISFVHNQRQQIIGPSAPVDTTATPYLSLLLPLTYKYPLL
jgi:hypothetical protein